MTDAPDAQRPATLGGLGAILLWSTTVAFARRLSEDLGPTTAAAAVYGVAGSVAVAVLLADKGRLQRIRDLPARYVAGCGTLFVAYTLLLFLAVGRAEGREQTLAVGLVNYLWPVLTILLSLPLLGRRPGRLLAPGILLALAGLALVVVPGGPGAWWGFAWRAAINPVAYGLAGGGAVCWALYSNLARRWAGGRPEGAVAIFLGATAMVMLLVCSAAGGPHRWSARALGEAAWLGLATWAAYGLWDRAMRRGDAVLVVAASFLTPFLSTVVSCVYLAVRPGAALWAGCVLLVAGSVLSWRSVRG